LLTFEEILEELRKVEEVELIELLNVTSDEIVNHFIDHIEDNLDKFKRYVEDNREEINSYE
jgi:cell division septum initiation protein DivIVA